MTTALLAALLVPATWAADVEDGAPIPRLSELAAAADVVALAQVRDTDYEYTRGFPTGGTAFLRVLIPYRVTRPIGDFVEVYEEGLHAFECYFEDPSVTEEGRRYLVFLRADPEVQDQFRGLEHGCALEVLVTRENRYVLRYPLSGIAVADDIGTLATPVVFADSYAVLAEDEIGVEERNALLAGGHLERLEEGGYRYTEGVPLEDLRPLLGEDNLTLDRALRRPVE